jgi:hypothetical protein
MLSAPIRITGVICACIIGLSFIFFVIDQSKGGSDAAQAEIAGNEHPTAPIATKPKQPRKFIDEAAHKLTTPFNNIVTHSDEWASHLVPTVLGLILFGFGFGFISRAVANRE